MFWDCPSETAKMAAVVKAAKAIRNNWKKSVFFTGLAVYGVKYAQQKYE